ncbi:hypothetical protein ANCCAN_10281 [Ancylostoma caninum]|uniref:Uncharacterized protein n=1 Tax=Ancylostoma caninum TaxID=29170 RepID=A0A368GLE5_ANCCA|nr:hypothetical protein ANCCAN_10281 [Ancylostoma caninum]
MLHGLYGYIFGAEDSNDSQASNDSEASLCPPGKMTEDDWCLVDGEFTRAASCAKCSATSEFSPRARFLLICSALLPLDCCN